MTTFKVGDRVAAEGEVTQVFSTDKLLVDFGPGIWACFDTKALRPAPPPERQAAQVCPKCNDTGRIVHASPAGLLGSRVDVCFCVATPVPAPERQAVPKRVWRKEGDALISEDPTPMPEPDPVPAPDTFVPPPHANAETHERIMTKLRASTPQEIVEGAVRAGIYTESGELTERHAPSPAPEAKRELCGDTPAQPPAKEMTAESDDAKVERMFRDAIAAERAKQEATEMTAGERSFRAFFAGTTMHDAWDSPTLSKLVDRPRWHAAAQAAIAHHLAATPAAEEREVAYYVVRSGFAKGLGMFACRQPEGPIWLREAGVGSVCLTRTAAEQLAAEMGGARRIVPVTRRRRGAR